MDLSQFLRTVVTTEQGQFCLAVRDGIEWRHIWFEWPNQLEAIIDCAEEHKQTCDVYFSSYLSSVRDRHKEFILPSRTIQADLDGAELSDISITPTILVQTSIARHQGYWVLSEETPDHERLSRRLSYAIPGCDLSGWPIGKMVRLPETFNHKYGQPQLISIINNTSRVYGPEDITMLADPFIGAIEFKQDETEFIETQPFNENGMGPHELLESFKDKISAPIYSTYAIEGQDRSAKLWALMCALFRAGASREEVYFLAYHSANNKFSSQSWGGDRDLAKDVLRAHRASFVASDDSKAMIAALKKAGGNASDRYSAIAQLIRRMMAFVGEFVRTDENTAWYLSRETGMPIQLTAHSEKLVNLLNITYGLNATEREHKYVMADLEAYSSTLPVTGKLAYLSHYDSRSNVLLLHTGRREVLKISVNSVEPVQNGSYGVVFPWIKNAEPVTPIYSEGPSCWADSLYATSLENVTNLPKDQAYALMKVWLLFLLLREEHASRPLVALFGQPGCLSGYTPITVKRQSRVTTYSLKTLYERMNFKGWKAVETLSFHENGMRHYGKIKQVIFSGLKQTYTVSIQGQESFRATLNHRFLTPTGYKQLSNLSVGDRVMVNDIPNRGLRPQPITAIDSFGWEDTYDIEMEDEEAPNFLVNDVVVHNSGKTSLFKKVYALIYGGKMMLGMVSNAGNFNTAVSTYPLYVFDNVDTWERWLPDRLAQLAGDISSDSRKLYTDNDAYTTRGIAFVGLTAHDPKFTRPDVVDRFIVLTFKRIHSFISEGRLVGDILSRRNVLWGHLINDLQKILQTPRPEEGMIELRSSDLVSHGRWFSQALGIEGFDDAINALLRAQKMQAVAEDSLLVEAMEVYTRKSKQAANFRSLGALWMELCSYSTDDKAFIRHYRSASNLGKKLWVLQQPLSQLFDMEWRDGLVREWRICGASTIVPS